MLTIPLILSILGLATQLSEALPVHQHRQRHPRWTIDSALEVVPASGLANQISWKGASERPGSISLLQDELDVEEEIKITTTAEGMSDAEEDESLNHENTRMKELEWSTSDPRPPPVDSSAEYDTDVLTIEELLQYLEDTEGSGPSDDDRLPLLEAEKDETKELKDTEDWFKWLDGEDEEPDWSTAPGDEQPEDMARSVLAG
ncbi:hypothetical protein IAR55_002675 [Kwoniella newhampshirensis]|uniref:Uncharacterized protein n=1 Tax=Kwoniella newhampshirensis TaxID=1651941 RepID=A0AAW0YPK0_9TREE